MAEIVLGTSNAFAARNWPEPSEWTRIIAEDLGLREVQFSFDLLDPTLPEPERSAACDEILQAVRAHRLTMSTTFTGLIVYAQNHLAHPNPVMRARAQAWYEDALAVSRRLSARACGGHIGALSIRDQAGRARRGLLRRKAIEAVRALTGVAAALGLEYFLWELMPIAREIVHTPAEAVAALEEANDGAAVPVKLCFDLGHCLEDESGAPADPYAWLERLLPWCPVIHLQQTDGKADRHWPFSPEHNAVGIIDPRRVIEIARSSPCDRVLLLFELSHSFDTPGDRIIDEHKASVEAWKVWV
jgi:D-erythrulose 1-phosphate 3-epimerase